MALVYDFSFTPEFAGQSAVVTNAAGAAVSGSPVTLDAAGVGSLSLDEGTYTATASNAAKGLGSAKTAGVLNLPASIAAGCGSGGATVSRGTLYLKATITNADVSTETWADGTGAPIALVLDTERQGATPIPDWADETAGVYSIIQSGAYVACLAGKGVITYDDAPAAIGIDLYHNEMAGMNYGWYSDGSDDSAAFTPLEVTPLAVGVKDSEANPFSALAADDFPVSLAGLVGDNYGDTTGNPTLTMDVLFSVTHIGSGSRYTSADFE